MLLRRLVFATLLGSALARLYVLGQARGWALVGPLTVRVVLTALAAWVVHVVVHELGHWVGAAFNDFEVRQIRFGPLVFDRVARKVSFSGHDLGGGVTSFPRGVGELRRRLRNVALAGPLATLGLTLVTAALYLATGAPAAGSKWGIALAMGCLVLATSFIPPALLPRRPGGGTDLEQMLGRRRLLAHWTHAALLQGLGEGRRVSELITRAELDALLDEEDPTVPLTLASILHAIETGPLETVRERIARAELHVGLEAPEWLVADLALVSGCFAALVEADLEKARACLEVMRANQAVPWFSHLLEACIAQRLGAPLTALDRWCEGLASYPHRVLAVTANGWALSRLAQGPAAQRLLVAHPRG